MTSSSGGIAEELRQSYVIEIARILCALDHEQRAADFSELAREGIFDECRDVLENNLRKTNIALPIPASTSMYPVAVKSLRSANAQQMLFRRLALKQCLRFRRDC